MSLALDDWDTMLAGTPFVAYCYAYPHKTAYRPFAPPRPLSHLWRDESRESLFLYIHVPFCEYRCGFCNLFTQSQPSASAATRYLDTLRREAEAVAESLGDTSFARLAIGGGTPTQYSVEQLDELFGIAASLGAQTLPTSCEASPATLTAEKLQLLRERGVTRLSLGVQSFDESDAKSLGRPIRRGELDHALELIQAIRPPVVNLDLIYGAESQTVESWLATIDEAVSHGPEELFLYPLYVRPLTGLMGRGVGESGGGGWEERDDRTRLYLAGRDRLLEHGYRQCSMRMFQRGVEPSGEPEYRCQADGMVGLGCGARSYTRRLHYSREYAVSSSAVAGILADYLTRDRAAFSSVDYGFELNEDEQRRRWLILSLLQADGLELAGYRRRFHGDSLGDFPQLLGLVERGLAELSEERLRLTPLGLAWSDAIGPRLYSQSVSQRMEAYTWR